MINMFAAYSAAIAISPRGYIGRTWIASRVPKIEITATSKVTMRINLFILGFPNADETGFYNACEFTPRPRGVITPDKWGR